jgi:pimeloyl-ACP methyl ester carboxylesterase
MAKQPLILLPGLLCDATVWRDQAAALSDLAECFIPDYGVIDTLAGMAECVLRDAPPRFALAGHSMGGRVAFEILRIAPERVERVALMDTRTHAKPAGEAGEKEAAGRYRLLEISRSRGMRAMAKEWIPGMVHPARLGDAELIRAIENMIAAKTPEIYAAQIHALLGRPDAEPIVASIRRPTLVLCGRQDAWSGLEWHEKIHAAVVGSTLEVVEDCGHMSTMERPEAVSAAMRRWLAV